jgi:serine/threonine-protein kinase RIO1
MRFIGEDGWAAPRLKDAALKPSERISAWRQARCLVITPAHGARRVA